MTLIKKQLPDKEKMTFETVFGLVIIVIVMALIAIFFPMLIAPHLK
jgi:hypothetical protein